MNQPQPTEPKASFAEQMRWLPGVLLRPRQTLGKIARQSGNVWFLPLLLLSFFAIAYAGVAARSSAPPAFAVIQKLESEQSVVELTSEQVGGPGDEVAFQQQAPVGGGFPVWLKGLGGVFRIWISWIILSITLYLAFILSGGRAESGSVRNIVAWAGLPLVLRDLVRILAVGLSHASIQHPGLSGLVSADPTMKSLFFGAFLGLLDVYLFWSLGLVILGGKAASGLSTGKTARVALLTSAMLLALYALVGAGSGILVQQITKGASFAGEF